MEHAILLFIKRTFLSILGFDFLYCPEIPNVFITNAG